MSQPNLVAPPKFEKRENGYVYVSYLGHSPQLLNSVETYLYSQVETLKAQLAHSESIRHAEKRILLTEIRMRAASEAQVRELRELLRGTLNYARSAGQLLDGQEIDVGMTALWQYIEKAGAVLRSAPPSEWEKSSQALRDSTQHVHDENMQTNAGEERKDLARQGCTDETRNDPAAGKRPIKAGAEQDSPSRSEWISVETKLPDIGEEIATYDARDNNHSSIGPVTKTNYTGSNSEVGLNELTNGTYTHWFRLPAPPSPAPEKEKAE